MTMYFYHHLKDQIGTQNVTRTNGMGFERGRMVITTANKKLRVNS